jgi:hypothetical protein
MAFSDDELSEGLNEFAADDGDSGGEDDALRNYARMWWAGDEATQMQIEKVLARMGWEIGQDEGGYDNGGVFVVRAGDENGNSYQSWPAEDLTEGVAEGHRDEDNPFEKGSMGDALYRALGSKKVSPQQVQRNRERFAKRDAEKAKQQGVGEATGDEKFDTMMSQMQREPKYPDSQMPPTDVKDLYQWAVKNNKPYHKIFATWANREGYKSVAPALQRAGNLDSDALDYWTPRVWEIYWGEVRGIDSEMPPEWAKKRIPDELRDYLETVFDAYDRIVFDWPTEYRQIGEQGVAEGSEDPFGPQGRFVGDTGPAQITTTVARVQLKPGDRVMYKPTGARARIENLYKNGTVARIHVASGMGGQYFDAKVTDLRPIGQGRLEEKSTSQAQFRTMAAAAHDPKFARKVGIKQSVAREFNKADTGQDYKSLPKKATEGAPVTVTPGSIEPGGAVDNFKQQMANNTERDMAEGNRKSEPPEADYGDDYQDMVKRVKKLAGLGPLKTVYDPNKRVYRNMPTAVQPRK